MAIENKTHIVDVQLCLRVGLVCPPESPLNEVLAEKIVEDALAVSTILVKNYRTHCLAIAHTRIHYIRIHRSTHLHSQHPNGRSCLGSA